MFLGCTISASTGSLTPTAVPALDSEILTISDAIYDELYVTTAAIDRFDGTIPAEWTFDTRLHALFNGDLYGGNVNFTEDIVQSVRIKKRTAKDSRFQTIYEKKIMANEDFAIELLDYYEPLGTIEYAYVPVISGGENDYIINHVESKFEQHFLIERDTSYPLTLSVTPTERLVYETKTIRPLNRQYPITVTNGNTGYYTGEIECLFLETGLNAQVRTRSANEYRERVYRMLTDSKPKLLKDYDGNLRMVSISADISESERTRLHHNQGSFTHVLTKFSWTESGNAYDTIELYHNGFLDTGLG